MKKDCWIWSPVREISIAGKNRPKLTAIDRLIRKKYLFF